jgi:hypothetical protein
MSLKETLANLSAWYRLAVVASAGWLLGSLAVIDPWESMMSGPGGLSSYNRWNEFFMVGALPVVALLGVLWIVSGFKKKSH